MGLPNVGDVIIRSRVVFPFRRDAWSIVKRLRQATTEYASPPELGMIKSTIQVLTQSFSVTPTCTRCSFPFYFFRFLVFGDHS